ncbi:hypothetical protein NGRA_0210 [Nosema granulosis]|uniref:Uncharacterized protein n=1 Tax=Nosema granulosis TaxID=83296 RepID=A0A9P6H194_9MICR|nr:hypothetical protein NGRA_0210 [Nosema granulosis]
MLKLEKLFKDLAQDPNTIQEIEKEINLLVHSENLNQTVDLYKSTIPEMKLYALKVVEERIKLKKANNLSLVQEIAFMKEAVQVDSSDKAADSFATLGLYEWPNFFPDFFQIIIDMMALKKEMGYKILQSFLYQMNYSQDINEKRKNELKKAIGLVYKGYMQLFEDDMAQFIIPILTESLRILPKDFDYSIVFRRGHEYPEKTVEFINEMGGSLPLFDVIDLASRMPIMVGVLLYFNSLKNKYSEVSNVNQMYEYIFKALRHDLSSFLVSVDFWTKFFGKKHKEAFVEHIMGEVLSIFVNLEDEQKNEVEGEVYGLFNVIIKNYPQEVFNLLKVNCSFLPKRLQLFFIRKIHERILFNTKNGIPTNFSLCELNSNDPIVTATIMVFNNDPKVVDMINCLDLFDKDSAKLVIRILDTFSLPQETISGLIDRCCVPGKASSNEVIVECFLKLGQIESFEGVWDHDKILRLFYYLRKSPMKVSHLSARYNQEFIAKAPFDRCFSILKMFGNIPREIYENIYANIGVYAYADLNCFIRDLLPYLSIQEPYISRITERLLKDWVDLENPEDLVACTKTLLSVFSEGIAQANEKNIPYHSINSLIDLLQLDDTGLIRRISDTFCNYKGVFDVKTALYYLLLNYNSSFVEGSHMSVASAITKCIKDKQGPVSLHEILGNVPLDKCYNLHSDIQNVQTKRAQNIVRVFLKDFKGKPLNAIYGNDFKVGEQGFIKQEKKKAGFEFSIERTFFD